MLSMKAIRLALALLVLLGAPNAIADTSDTDCSTTDVRWLWSGALSSHSLTFKLGLRDGHACGDRAFVVHAHPELQPTERPHTSIALCHPTDAPTVHVCEFTESLHAARAYQYELRATAASDDDAVARTGTFRTPAREGTPMNFRVAFSSCADEDSDPRVFDAIAGHNPLLFLHMGDLHYHNLAVNDVSAFRSAYHSLFASPAGQAMLAINAPTAYMWDDHDFGPDNSDKTAPGRDAASSTYREFVPHYPLVASTNPKRLGAIHQAFTIGRVRFILTDLRSERTPNNAKPAPSKSVLGVQQKQWFKDELLASSASESSIKLIIWVSTMPWNDDERKWGHFQHEQMELIHFLRAHNLNTRVPIVIASGDAHMLAVDDGRHSPGNLTVLHAAALGRPGSIKGGPYSHGAYAGSGQYGILEFVDSRVADSDNNEGDRVCVRYSGISIDKGELIAYDTCDPLRTPPKQPYYPPSIAMRQLQRVTKKILRRIGGGNVQAGGIVVVGGLLAAVAYAGKRWQTKRSAAAARRSKRD